MATNRDFSTMLNDYLPLDLLQQEYMKRDYVYSKADKIDDWKNGPLIVPFEGQNATSVEFGQLADVSDIAKYDYVRGEITTQPEAWGSLLFNHKDLMEHDGKIKEASFLKMLPNQIDDFMNYFKMVVSVNMLNGPHFATVTVDGTAAGVIEVDRVDRFAKSQKVILDDSNSAPGTYYVIAIDINGGTLKRGAVTLSATRGGAAADVSAYTVAQAAKTYHPGAQAAPFTSLKSQLLSLANAGTATLFGQTKLSYPYLQAVQIDGAAVSASNILEKIFDGYTQRQIQGKAGNAGEVLMSLKNFGACLKLLEVQKGSFNVTPGSRKTAVYGWDTIEIGSVTGQMIKLVGIQEMDNDVIMYLDWDVIKFYSNGLFRRRTAPDGKQYYEVRATTGYYYVLDHSLFGDIVCTAPWKCAIMHSINF